MGKKGNTMIILIFILALVGCILIYVLFEAFMQSELPQKIKALFSSINPFKKNKASSENKENVKEFTVPVSWEYCIEGSTGLCSYAGSGISLDSSVIDQLDSMQKQINALSADLYRLEETEYEHHVDFFKELNRLSEAVSSKKKPAKKKVVKKKHDDHKVHTKAYKNTTKAKK